MTDLDLRGGGHVDFAYNFFPWMSDLPLRETDMQHMPGRTLFWTSTIHCDDNLQRLFNPDYLHKDCSYAVQVCVHSLATPAWMLFLGHIRGRYLRNKP